MFLQESPRFRDGERTLPTVIKLIASFYHSTNSYRLSTMAQNVAAEESAAAAAAAAAEPAKTEPATEPAKAEPAAAAAPAGKAQAKLAEGCVVCAKPATANCPKCNKRRGRSTEELIPGWMDF